MDSNGTYNNRGDRSRSAVSGMVHSAGGLARRSGVVVGFCGCHSRFCIPLVGLFHLPGSQFRIHPNQILHSSRQLLSSCIAHIITAVIGSGVLSLAWSTAQLGWIEGPVAILCFAIVIYVSSFLLADCYRSPDPVTGDRNYSYMQAVRVFLKGRKQEWFCGFLQNRSVYGFGVAYVITTSTSMRAIQRANCYHREGHQAPCVYGSTVYMVVFGLTQVVMSQIPDNIQRLSAIAAIMSFAYSFIGLGLGLAQVIINGRIKGNITGVPASSTANKLWLIFQALGDIAFAYPYSIILLEIQKTKS
ncbi:probable amino acid permease 7 [Carica papaya]|uniref:probable amino acid permease 7 n=1 Tax=Carica papaya TaxID=3649 RepID=UPI000B8CF861|nr:probable amino acid permease 7 [Carica papaya]